MSKDKEDKKESKELQKRNGGKAIETGTPFSFMRTFAEDMERLFDDFQGVRVGSLFGREFFPFTKEFAHVELTDEALTISGERKEEKEEKREGYYRSERSYGSFYRCIPLPEGVKTDTAKAEFRDGVLVVTMQAPKSETHGRVLEIKTEEPAQTQAAAR
jgi:HSP20 family protein